MGMRNSVLPRRRLAAINPSCGNYLFITYHSEVISTGMVNVKLARFKLNICSAIKHRWGFIYSWYAGFLNLLFSRDYNMTIWIWAPTVIDPPRCLAMQQYFSRTFFRLAIIIQLFNQCLVPIFLPYIGDKKILATFTQ